MSWDDGKRGGHRDGDFHPDANRRGMSRERDDGKRGGHRDGYYYLPPDANRRGRSRERDDGGYRDDGYHHHDAHRSSYYNARDDGKRCDSGRIYKSNASNEAPTNNMSSGVSKADVAFIYLQHRLDREELRNLREQEDKRFFDDHFNNK